MNNPVSMMDFEEDSKSLRDYINMLRRRKRAMAYAFASVVTVVTLLAILWPATYRSESIILIEQQDIPPELVQTTITSYAQERIEQIKTRIMTINNIMKIVDDYALYSERDRERKTRTEIAQEFRDAVKILPISADVVDPRSGRPSTAVIAFSLAFDGEQPGKVQKVANELTTLYLDENLKERTEQTLSTSEFLTAEAKLLSEQLEKLDAEIADFKEQNKGALPENAQFNLSVVDRTELQINELDFRVKELKKSKYELESDLVRLNPNAPVILETGAAVLDDADRLKALQTELRKAEATYTDNHPTVVRLRREVADLEASQGGAADRDDLLKQLQTERDNLKQLQSKYTADAPQIEQARQLITVLEKAVASSSEGVDAAKADNPAYLVTKNRLLSTEEDIRVNTEKLAELRAKIEKFEGYLSKAPQVEKEYQRMQRDQENTYRKYREIRAKQMSAELAKNLESEQKGERFTLVQPPELPVDPVSPNRVALFLLGIILAGGAGVGIALLLEALDDGVYSISDVVNITGVAPLVSVPYMETREEARQHDRKRFYIVIVAVVAIVIVLAAFHLFVKPLDVTWYILLRKLGIN